MIHLSKVWPLLLLLIVSTYNTHSLSLLPPSASSTYFPDTTMSTPMTYPPPATLPPSTPPACMTYDGIVLDIPRGEFREIDCQFCYCDYNGNAYCYYGDCMPAMCVDPVSGGCCSWCPNGNNCLLPSGEILPEGEVRIYEDMSCQCPDLYDYYSGYYFYYYNEYDKQALCFHMPPTPDPCDYTTCVPLLCVDAVTPPGGCCPECPNGNNCYLPSGEILPEGEIRVYENMECQCRDPYNYEYYYDYYYYNQYDQQAICYPMPTTPDPCEYATCMPLLCVDAETPPGGCCPECLNGNNCYLPSGEILPEGEIRMYENMVCQCRDPYNGGYYYDYYNYNGQYGQQAMCYPIDTTPNPCDYATCAPLPCVDAVVPPGGCCPECLNGCALPSGGVIAPGEIRLIDGMLCNCPPETCTPSGKLECFPVTSTPPTTTTSGCRTWDNQFLDLQPGESKTEGCGFCYCDWDGIGYCYYTGACPPPPCADAEVPPGGCCAECPNGPNCQLPSGGILKAGETIDENGMNCSCPLDTYNYDYGYYNWGPVSLCQPSGCRTMDGQLLDLLPGESRASECEYCSCGPDGVGYCVYPTCPPPPCVDAVVPPSGCCAECLNGQNCKLPDGNILHGSEPQEVDGMVCQCPELSYESGSETEERHITAECFSIPTTGTTPFFTTTEAYPTTPPLGCLTSDGNFMYPGEEKETVGPGYCHILKCTYDSNLEEMWGDCIPAMCVDARFSGCCPSCPNGQNCKLPNGKILHGSEPQEIDGMVCQCPEQSFEFGSATEERHITAKCTTGTTPFFTTTEAYPTTPPLGCMTSDGNFIYPGEEKMTVGPGYCHILICTFDSNLEEMFGDCIPAMCVDAQSSGCCPSCPNGQNCRLPNGSILHGSEPQEIDGMVCKCPETSYDIGIPTLDQHITAECYSASTVSDTSCLTTT